MMGKDEGAKRPLGPIGRALRNAGWLLGGKGVGGLLSLVYLGLAARSLGVNSFGDFALILSYGQAVANIVGFQSWQTVIRFGAVHLAAGHPERLRRIFVFAALLDFVAALAGAALAAAGVLIVGPLFGWSADVKYMAALFGLSLVLAIRGAPTGVLRLFDRFDLAAYTETVLPAARLIGAVAAWLAGATVAGFLIAWAFAELATTIAMWLAARRELARHGLGDRIGRFVRGVVAENPTLWRFTWTTNIAGSINLLWQQMPTLAVGWFAGPAAAGGFRIASQLSAALAKPVLALTRAIYPELAKLAVDGGVRALVPIVRRSTLLAVISGVVLVLLIALAGDLLINIVAGPQYSFVYPFLLLLSIAAALNLFGFAFEPALVALGRPGLALVARAAAGLLFIGLMAVLLTSYGAIGAAIASIIATVLAVVFLATALWGVARS